MSLNIPKEALDATKNPHLWRSMLENPKTKELAVQGISMVVGEEASKLPKELHEKIVKLLFLWSTGQITLGNDEAGLGQTPKFDTGEKTAVSKMIAKMCALYRITHRQGGYLERSVNNIPQADPKGKGDKFIDEIAYLKKIKALPEDLSKMTVRDVGGGDGSMMSQIDKNFLHLEKEPAIYEVASYDKPKCRLIKYNDDFSIPEDDSSIDLVTMNMVLHHIEDPNFTLQELHRVMKDGGTFIMRETDTRNDPGVESFQHVMDHVWYKSNSHASTVTGVPLKMQFREKEEIVELFRKNGFESVDVRTHENDMDNIFYPKFFAFQCVKSASCSTGARLEEEMSLSKPRLDRDSTPKRDLV